MGDYCALADVQARLPDLDSTAGTTALITELCGEATKIFTQETGRRFDKTTATSYFSGNGKRKLFIPDLAALTTIRCRASTNGTWSNLTLTPVEGIRAGDVILGPEQRDSSEPAGWLRIIDFPAGSYKTWPYGDATIEIAGDWGYAAVPVDVKEATAELVVAMYKDRGASAESARMGVGGMGFDGRIRTYPDITYRVMQRRKKVLVA